MQRLVAGSDPGDAQRRQLPRDRRLERAHRSWHRLRPDRPRADDSQWRRDARRRQLGRRLQRRASRLSDDHDRYWSFGVGTKKGFIFNPDDSWGLGYARMDLASGDTEHLTEGYYNLQMTEKLRLSFSLQHVIDTPSGATKFGYLLPGVRLQAAF